jgi:hypothetical protein
LTYLSEAQARRGEEPEIDPDQFQDPDNEYGLFAGTPYEADDEEANRIYEDVIMLWILVEGLGGVFLGLVSSSHFNPFFCLHFSEKHESKQRLQNYVLRGPRFSTNLPISSVDYLLLPMKNGTAFQKWEI